MFTKSDLKKLIIPLIIEQTLALTVGIFDTIMVASAGESAVSGVSLVETVNILLINLFAALATGGAIVVGQYLGRGDKEKSHHTSHQLISATLILSLFIMIICLAFNKPILSLCFGSIENDVMQQSRIYFYITALSYPFIAMFNSAAALFRIMGDSKTPMLNALIMNVVNIIGNAIFIYGFGLGVIGAGIATLISRLIAAFTTMYMLRKPSLDISVRTYYFWRIDWPMVKRILRIGIPNGLENSMFQIGKIILTSLVAIHGTAAIAGNAIGSSVAIIEVIPGMALGLAITTVVSQCMGAKQHEEANKHIKYLMKLAYIYMIILNVCMLICVKPILSIFQLSKEAYDFAFQILIIHGIAAMSIWTTSFTLPNAFRAAGDVKFPMIISICSMWLFRIGLSYYFVYVMGWGAISIWLAMVVDWLFRSILFLWRWLSGKWKGKAVI